MHLTPHQAQYIAHDLNPHQIEAEVFALHSPLSKGVLLDHHMPKDLPPKNRHRSKRHPSNTGQQPLLPMTALLFNNKSSAGSVQKQLPHNNHAK